MPLTNRRRIFAARATAVAATVLLPGRWRVAAWLAHELLRIGPAVVRNNDWYGPVAKTFQTDAREVWLTIDDGPTPTQTPEILGLLARRRARASFFVIGENVNWNRELSRRIVAEGHTLENHTQTHPSGLFWALPSCLIREEIVRCQHAIRVAAGVSPTWFRSPAGMTNPGVHPIAARHWLRLAGWSADGLDGLPGREPEDAVERIWRRVKPGAIIVLHEGEGRRPVETLTLLLDRLDAGGYRCVIPEGRRVG